MGSLSLDILAYRSLSVVVIATSQSSPLQIIYCAKGSRLSSMVRLVSLVERHSSHASQVVNHDVPVLVVGGGPAGMLAALQLSKNGISCLMAERNLDTTKWPKMDITNARSMELLKRLGIDQGLRSVGMCSPSFCNAFANMLLQVCPRTTVSMFCSALGSLTAAT